MSPPLGNGKKSLSLRRMKPRAAPLRREFTTVLCLGVFPSPSAGGVSAYKKVIDFFGSNRWCITLEHIVQFFCCLAKSSDCRSDISGGTWIHHQRKVHPSLPPFSVLKRQYTGVGSEAVYPNLRNVLLYSPGLDASVLQRDLDVPLVTLVLAAFHALCCQLCTMSACPGS